MQHYYRCLLLLSSCVRSGNLAGHVFVYLRFEGASKYQIIGARNEWWVMLRMIGKCYSGTLGGGLKLPDICLTGEEKSRKISPRKLVQTGDRTRARCVTGAHATTCPTAVDGRPRDVRWSSARSIQSPASQPTSLKFILILSSHLRLGLSKGLFSSGFPTETFYAFLYCSISTTCPFHLSRFNLRLLIT